MNSKTASSAAFAAFSTTTSPRSKPRSSSSITARTERSGSEHLIGAGQIYERGGDPLPHWNHKYICVCSFLRDDEYHFVQIEDYPELVEFLHYTSTILLAIWKGQEREKAYNKSWPRSERREQTEDEERALEMRTRHAWDEHLAAVAGSAR